MSGSRKSLEHKAGRYNSHFLEKSSVVESLPATMLTEANAESIEDAPTKRRKIVLTKEDDDAVTRACINIANQHTAQSLAEGAHRFPSRAVEAKFDYHEAPTERIPVYTRMRSVSEYPDAAGAEASGVEAQSAPVTISGESFKLRNNLETIFDEKNRYWNKESAKTEQGLEGYRKEEVSRTHIAKVLWIATPDRPFAACMFAEQGWCQSQLDPKLRHPGREGMACMAYYSADEYRLLEAGTVLPEKHTLCEFCYRFMTGRRIERVSHGSHHAEEEIPSRYYLIGAGEYSLDGMHQPVEKKNAQYPDGVLGHMRMYNTSDFVPVVGALEEGGTLQPARIWHYDAWRRAREEGTLPAECAYVFGWEETKPFASLNSNALPQVNQIDPYLRSTVTFTEQLTVAATLRAYFARSARLAIQPSYVHIFQDLMECVADPDYLERPRYRSRSGKRDWQRFCLHAREAPPSLETHRIYYTLLVKINTCKQIYDADKPIETDETTKQNLQVYIEAHSSLLVWMRNADDYSDHALLNTLVPHPSLPNVTLPVLHAYYPTDRLLPRPRNYLYATQQQRIHSRDTPLDTCRRAFVCEAAERLARPPAQLPFAYSSLAKLYEGTPPANYMHELREHFDANVRAVGVPTFAPEWQGADLGYIKRMLLDDRVQLSTEELTARAWQIADNALRADFAQIDEFVTQRQARLGAVVQRYATLVFMDFKQTVHALQYHDNLGELVRFIEYGRTLIPGDGAILVLTENSVNGHPLAKYCTLLACLLRVYVSETLRELVSVGETRLRHHLHLFRNSHLALFRKITENPTLPLPDVELVQTHGTDTRIRVAERTLLDQYYPDPTREVHQGDLPDYVNSLSKVNFVNDGAMDEHPWIKMHFKNLGRCCAGREYTAMLQKLCMSDATFYGYTCLELELAFKGLYETCTVVPSFARSLALDELFDNIEVESVKQSIIQLIIDNQALIAEATSESMCYMIDHAPALKDALEDVYRDWFDWRVRADMDMARQCYNETGDFTRYYEVVQDRVKLHSIKSIYRHIEGDFVPWLCKLLKKLEEEHFKAPEITPTPPEAHLTFKQRLIMQCVVYYLDPTQEIEASDLRVTGMSEETLQTLLELNRIFERQTRKGVGITDKDEGAVEANAAEILRVFARNTPQYVLVSFFFTMLHTYRNFRQMRINNLNVLERQMTQLKRQYSLVEHGEVPANATHCVFSVCCCNVKNTFRSAVDTFAVGNDDVHYCSRDDIYTCGKPEHRNGKRKHTHSNAMLQARLTGEPSPEETRAALKQSERDLKRPICSEVEVFAVNALGVLVETDGVKIPRSKKKKKDSGKKIAPPTSPYWITPCCGILFGYEYKNWFPGGYACGTCSKATELANAFREVFCQCCHAATRRFRIVATYDEYALRYTRSIFCNTCYRKWSHFDAPITTYMIVKGSTDQEYVNQIAAKT